MKKLNLAIAKAVVKYRQLSQLSQEELADLADIHRTYVSQIERGIKTPSVAVLFSISKALGVNPSHLVSEIESIYNEI